MISFLLGIAVAVRNCYQSEDATDTPRRVKPKEVQRNEPELLTEPSPNPNSPLGLLYESTNYLKIV